MPTPQDEEARAALRDEDAEGFTDVESSPTLPSATLARAASATAEPIPAVHDTYREIWTLSWPVMLGQVLVNAVSLIDIAMVGRLGSDAVAAVGYATQFFFVSQSVLFAVGFACVALMARSIGAGDPARARRALTAALEVSVAVSLIVIGVVLVAPQAWLRLLGAQPAVIEAAVPYLTLLLGSSVLLAVSITIESGLRAARNTKTPMQIALVVAVVKTLLNSLLIFGALGFPRLELVGAGIATVAAQAVGVALFIAVARRAGPHAAVGLRRGDLPAARPLVREVVRIAAPSVGERLAMNLALLAYFRVLSEYGAVAIAAYTVGIRVLAFSWIPGTGFGAAAATLVGQALGAGDPRAAARAGWRSTGLAVFVAVALGGACALARTPLARLFTDDLPLIAELGPFLLCLALAQPFLQAHFTLGGAHRGAGDTWTPFVAAAFANWALRVPLAFFLAYALRADVVWIWYTLMLDHFARTAWLARSFRRGRWRERLSAHPSS